MTEVDIMYLVTLAAAIAVIVYQKKMLDKLEDKVIRAWKKHYGRDEDDQGM